MSPIKRVDNVLNILFFFDVFCQQAADVAVLWVLWFLLHPHTIGDVPFPGARASAVIKGCENTPNQIISLNLSCSGSPCGSRDPVQLCPEKSQPKDLGDCTKLETPKPQTAAPDVKGEGDHSWRWSCSDPGFMLSLIFQRVILEVQLMSWLWCPALPRLSFIKGVRARFQLPKLQ